MGIFHVFFLKLPNDMMWRVCARSCSKGLQAALMLAHTGEYTVSERQAVLKPNIKSNRGKNEVLYR